MDIRILLALQSFREALPSFFPLFFVGVSFLAEPYVPLILTMLIYWCINKKTGLLLLLSSNLGSLYGSMLKVGFCVYRPWIRDAAIHPATQAISGAGGYSFPSVHSAQAVSFLGIICNRYGKKRFIIPSCVILTMLVAFSRCFLGVHTPQDVLVGLAIGALAVMSSLFLIAQIERGGKRDLYIMIGGLIICALSMLYTSLRTYPMDYDVTGNLLVDPVSMQHVTYLAIGAVIGLLPGIYCEKRYVGFTTDVALKKRIIRFVSGLIVVLFFYVGVRKLLQLFLGTNYGSAIGAALSMFYGIFVHPLLFTKWEERK